MHMHAQVKLGDKDYHCLFNRKADLGSAVLWSWRYFHNDLAIHKEVWQWMPKIAPKIHALLKTHAIDEAEWPAHAPATGAASAQVAPKEMSIGTKAMLIVLVDVLYWVQARCKDAAYRILVNVLTLAAQRCKGHLTVNGCALSIDDTGVVHGAAQLGLAQQGLA